MCLTLSRKIRESAMWRWYSSAGDLPAAERGPVRLVRPAQEREEAAGLVLEVARPLQVLEPLLQCLVEADHHRRGRSHPAFDDRPLRVEVVAHEVLPFGVPLAEVLGQDLAAAACDPVDACVAEARRRFRVREPGAVGEEHELGDSQRVELHALAVALAHRREQVAVVVERELRVEAAVEADEVATDVQQLVDLVEDLLTREDVAAVLVRQDVERAVVALGDADVGVVDDPHDHVGRTVGLVVPPANLLRTLLQLLVGRVQPEVARLVDGDAGHRTSMKELTEKTARPVPASP